MNVETEYTKMGFWRKLFWYDMLPEEEQRAFVIKSTGLQFHVVNPTGGKKNEQ